MKQLIVEMWKSDNIEFKPRKPTRDEISPLVYDDFSANHQVTGNAWKAVEDALIRQSSKWQEPSDSQ